MILWKDFILDDELGPVLMVPEGYGSEDVVYLERRDLSTRAGKDASARAAVAELEKSVNQKLAAIQAAKRSRTEAKRLGRRGIMDDALGFTIQETGQEKQPARMVGSSGLESHAGPDRDVGTSDRSQLPLRPRRRGV